MCIKCVLATSSSKFVPLNLMCVFVLFVHSIAVKESSTKTAYYMYICTLYTIPLLLFCIESGLLLSLQYIAKQSNKNHRSFSTISFQFFPCFSLRYFFPSLRFLSFHFVSFQWKIIIIPQFMKRKKSSSSNNNPIALSVESTKK